MITEEELIHRLTNIRISYGDIMYDHDKRVRFLGAMEAMLLVLGELEFGQPFDYKDIEEVEYNMFKKNGVRTRKEEYREFIIRKVDNVVKKDRNEKFRKDL